MLGSGINPESFKQDYSGFTRAAEMQAQGMADLGASIGGAIKDFAAEKKQINQDIAKGKSALQFAKANYPELAGRIDEIGKIFSDVNVSKAEQAAAGSQMGDFVAAMIRGQEFNKEIGLQERILGIQEAEALARNAPPMPERFGFTGSELKKTDKGGLYVLKGNDGLDYDPKTKLPIFDLAAFGEGLPSEVWSGSSTFSDDLGDLTTPGAFLPGESPSAAIDYANSLTGNTQTSSFPTNLNVSRSAPFLSPRQIESAANIGTNPLLGSRSGDNSDLPAIEAANQAANQDGLQPRYIIDEGKAEEPVTITMERLSELIALGVRPSGSLNPDGTFSVTDFNTGTLPAVTPSVIERNTEAYNKARDLYEAGDRDGALSLLRALRATDVFGDITDQTLDSYFSKEASPAPSTNTAQSRANKKPIGQFFK